TLGFWEEPIAPGGGAGGTVLGVGVSASACNDAKPGIPTGFTAVAGPGVGEVILSWTPPSPPYTYFLIAYSDSSSWPPKWGNPDVGNVSTYTVSGLGSGTYWFWVRAGNGCMPGDFVGPVSPGWIAGIPGAVVAPGFAPGVLGVKTPGELGEALATEEGEIAGVEVENICWWWLILSLAEFAILSLYYWWLSRQEKQRRYWWLVAPILAILAYIGDQFVAHQYFVPSRFCFWMWLWVLITASVPTGIYLYFKRK
ncbi:fibronectin type III domain-containing protein, partial [Patescibacteria group bacterium]|nr:fibronectin type III domain-containing protein [Patescibacteria group bacterium]